MHASDMWEWPRRREILGRDGRLFHRRTVDPKLQDDQLGFFWMSPAMQQDLYGEMKKKKNLSQQGSSGSTLDYLEVFFG